MVDNLKKNLDSGNVSLLFLLDLSELFNIVDHGSLLGCLSDLGLGRTVLQWFHAFLSETSLKVMLGDCCSSP